MESVSEVPPHFRYHPNDLIDAIYANLESSRKFFGEFGHSFELTLTAFGAVANSLLDETDQKSCNRVRAVVRLWSNNLSDHPKPATDYHLKTGQRE